MGAKAYLCKNVKTSVESRSEKYARRFNLSRAQERKLRWKMLDYLDGCKDDSARRVLLGIGRPR